MKIINTRLHGVLDYLFALLIVSVPFAFGFRDNAPASYTCYIFGTVVLISSVCTQYELGLVKVIPMRIHLILDLIGGIVVLVSPWIFGFANRVHLPHMIAGIFDLIVVLLSQSLPKHKKTNYKNLQHA